MDWMTIVRAALFALFAVLTSVVNAMTGPIYEHLLIPEMSTTSLYAPYLGNVTQNNVFLRGAELSNYVLINIVDPLAVLVVMAIGGLYLIRATMPEKAYSLTHLAPRMVIGILLANTVLPITWVIWSIAASVYPVISSYDGGAWMTYSNIVPAAGLQAAWDNGILAFAASLALFSLVLALTFIIAFRDALTAVLLVLLPPLTMLWPIPSLSGLAKRAWRLFGEMAFLPSLIVIPLILAVGAGSILIVIALFTVAVGMPVIISQAGANLVSAGFPHSGSLVSGSFAGGYDKAGRLSSEGLAAGRKGFNTRFDHGNGREGKDGGNKKNGDPPDAGLLGGAPPLSSGPGGAATGIMWGAGQSLGQLGKMISKRHAALKALRTDAPSALPSAQRIPQS